MVAMLLMPTTVIPQGYSRRVVKTKRSQSFLINWKPYEDAALFEYVDEGFAVNEVMVILSGVSWAAGLAPVS